MKREGREGGREGREGEVKKRKRERERETETYFRIGVTGSRLVPTISMGCAVSPPKGPPYRHLGWMPQPTQAMRIWALQTGDFSASVESEHDRDARCKVGKRGAELGRLLLIPVVVVVVVEEGRKSRIALKVKNETEEERKEGKKARRKKVTYHESPIKPLCSCRYRQYDLNSASDIPNVPSPSVHKIAVVVSSSTPPGTWHSWAYGGASTHSELGRSSACFSCLCAAKAEPFRARTSASKTARVSKSRSGEYSAERMAQLTSV